jgi:hypothetical protein
MKNAKSYMPLAGLLAILALFPVGYSDCASTATASPPSEEKCDWYCKNLKQDWNYLFHPDRINQCKPRELKDYQEAPSS